MPIDHQNLWAQWGILNHARYRAVLKQYGSLKVAWQKINRSFLQQLNIKPEALNQYCERREFLDVDSLENKISHLNITALSIDDELYPTPLKEIADPPPFIFVRGKLPSWHKAIGVVGTRNKTTYGQYATQKITSNLVQHGFVIVSGLAMGVDAIAHQTTLQNNGITVAVLGSGVDEITPSANRHLGEAILKNNGAIISEFPLGTTPEKFNFPKRNRIISGLSRGVVITEGGVKSGALITARYALEQNRDVFAVPNNIHSTSLSGTNHLIRRGEAKLIESADDILAEYQMQSTPKQTQIEFTAHESRLIEVIANEGKSIDDISNETKLNVATLSETLINLQLKGIVRQVDQKWIIA